MQINFYLPPEKIPNPLPDSADKLVPLGGDTVWILNTYLRLKEANFSCQLVSQIPQEGIVIIHRQSLKYKFKPNLNLFIVCIKADKNSYPYSHIEIVQNRAEVQAPFFQVQSVKPEQYLLPCQRYYMPHWLQPGLMPRNPIRGDSFKNIAYFGVTYNLAPELRTESWKKKLRELGFNWRRETNRNHWNDYSEVDAIIAVRNFEAQTDYSWKPATKLHLAWHANIPAILGVESAFRSERKTELDYLEVQSADEAISALQKLKDNPDLRQAMIENGKIRAKETQTEIIIQRWSDFLTNICIPTYQDWCRKSDFDKQKYFLSRYLGLKFSEIKRKIAKFNYNYLQ